MDKKIGIVVTARVKSRRLPAKIMAGIGRMKALEILLSNVIRYNNFEHVLAIPQNKEDDQIVDLIKESNIPINIYRGEDESPLHRISAVCKKYGWDYVVRITADDILINTTLLKKHVQFTVKNYLDYSWIGKCPEGVAGEVIRCSVLNKIADSIDKPVEFISYLLKKDDIKSGEFNPPHEYQYQFRLTLDYPEDLLLLRTINASLAPGYETLDIINFLKKNSYLMAINHLPKVTAYITNYNYSEYVLDAIKSVMRQSFKDWELLIYDDCSTDDSLKKIMRFVSKLEYSYRNKIKVYANERNIGLPSTCNRALKEARGKYIIRIDADDTLKINATETMVDYLDNNYGVGGVFSHHTFIDGKGKVKDADVFWKKHPGCCMLSKRAVNEIKYRDGLEYFEGDEFLNRFEKLYKTEIVNDVLWNYRRHDKQKTSGKNDNARIQTATSLKVQGVEVIK